MQDRWMQIIKKFTLKLKHRKTCTLPGHKYCNVSNNECILSCRLVWVIMFLWSNHWKMTNYLKYNERLAYPLSFQRRRDRRMQARPRQRGYIMQHESVSVILGVWGVLLDRGIEIRFPIWCWRVCSICYKERQKENHSQKDYVHFKTKLAYPEQIFSWPRIEATYECDVITVCLMVYWIRNLSQP